MKPIFKIFLTIAIFCSFTFAGFSQALAVDAKFDINKMSDMSDFDPNNPVLASGDVVKIGLLQIFSGPGAGNGEIFWATCNWVAHDINKRGGLMIDGKKKKILFVKGDTKGKPADTKKAAERLVLQDKVDILWGTSGSHLAAIISQVAAKYKVIHVNTLACSDYLMDAEHFSPYVFQTFTRNSTFGQAGAYYYGQVRKKEKKFYILCQDYAFGHSLADEFKIGLKKYFPDAEIVGEDYHPLFAKDFAPYVTKIKASGAEVIYTGDWLPDGGNLVKACRDMGINIPLLNIFIDEPNALHAIGVEGTKGLVNMNHYMGDLKDPARAKFSKVWGDLWANKWQKPYNTWLYKWPAGTIGDNIMVNYWLMSVLERAASTDPEKIIKVWEGDEYQTTAGVLKMRADDHTAIRDMYITEYVPPPEQKVSMTVEPYYWFEGISSTGKIVTIPAKYCIPTLDPKLKGRASK
ncbi:MAG: ABC transporter substrate-binding protein [Desulfobacterales bacterium]|jgi:ABC-type branched-subunit amino acid transport system substrate-binding protein